MAIYDRNNGIDVDPPDCSLCGDTGSVQDVKMTRTVMRIRVIRCPACKGRKAKKPAAPVPAPQTNKEEGNA